MEFTPEQAKALHKIELLLRKATGNANENEAAVATQLAQDLLAKYNLAMENVGQGDAVSAERQDTKIPGGALEFERELWRAIAELNWCWYFAAYEAGVHKGHKVSRVHRLIGKKVNILSTKMMAEYLMTTLNRLAKEYCLETYGSYHNRSAPAISFRKGAAERLASRLHTKRYEILRAEREAAETAPEGNGMAVTMAAMSQSEYERNYDFLYGVGSYAKMKVSQAKYAAEAAEREAREAEWKKNNPKEAAKLEREAEKKARKDQERWNRQWERDRSAPKASDMGAYHAGSRAGGEIGLDGQVSSPKVPGKLRSA